MNNHFTVDPEPLEVETVSKSCDNFINQLLMAIAPINSILGIDLCLSETTNALAATKVNCTVPSVSHVKNIHVPNRRSRACENACNCGSPFAMAGFRHRSNSTSVSLFISSTFCSQTLPSSSGKTSSQRNPDSYIAWRCMRCFIITGNRKPRGSHSFMVSLKTFIFVNSISESTNISGFPLIVSFSLSHT